jgi:putative YhdH/YhfP family quinone oxidoreductase
MDKTFKAVVIEEVDGKWKACFKTLGLSDLPLHDVLVEVEFSSLNYKDGLAVSGRQKIARKPPLIAGGDLAGTVIESASPEWRVGDRVVVNGWGLSETQAGGNTAYQRVKPDWLVRIPDRFTTRQAMAIGTAGYTAALCVEAIETWGVRDSGDVLVTGAAGGVGSVAIALLATRSLRVTASTGRPSTHDYLAKLGATGFVPREELAVSGAPAAKGEMGRRHRFSRRSDARQCAVANDLWRRRCGLRPCRWGGDAESDSPASHTSRDRLARHRLGHGAARQARTGLGTADTRPEARLIG